MYKMSREKIKNVDALLVLNFDKENKKNYIGGATFIENKRIYLMIYHKAIYMMKFMALGQQ